jgi:NAD(P)-dependent dehydrogenase (short-subunit alcohol dehydrogenase family)
MKRLEGKIAVITGGGSGIGLAAARDFLAEGAKVAITGRDAAKLQRAADSLKGGDRLLHHAADLVEPAQVEALAKKVADKLGPVDILVNTAGMNVKNRALREVTPESWKQQVAANLDSAFFCVKAFLPAMLERKAGLIICINSVAGLRAGPLGGIAYDAAKFGLRGMTTCLAEELRETGIRVTSIFPGEVDTPILENRPTPVTAEHKQRILQPEDVAAAVLFVATLPARAAVPELVIKPVSQMFV